MEKYRVAHGVNLLWKLRENEGAPAGSRGRNHWCNCEKNGGYCEWIGKAWEKRV